VGDHPVSQTLRRAISRIPAADREYLLEVLASDDRTFRLEEIQLPKGCFSRKTPSNVPAIASLTTTGSSTAGKDTATDKGSCAVTPLGLDEEEGPAYGSPL
jgi:hypothetical protein